MLALEPWSFTQAEIRATTLKAARRLYVDQAVRRAEWFRRKDEPRPAGDAGVFPSRDEWVATYEGIYGKVKDFGADWDRLKAAMDAEVGGVG